MKNHQIRERKHNPRHIYSSTHVPLIFPILALSIYLSVFSISASTVISALFPSPNQYKRCASYIENILKKHEVEIKRDFGIDIGDLGDHRLQKKLTTGAIQHM